MSFVELIFFLLAMISFSAIGFIFIIKPEIFLKWNQSVMKVMGFRLEDNDSSTTSKIVGVGMIVLAFVGTILQLS